MRIAQFKAVRQAVADYMGSEGCDCCSNIEKHREHKAKLASLLNVPKWKDGSGYCFKKFQQRR